MSKSERLVYIEVLVMDGGNERNGVARHRAEVARLRMRAEEWRQSIPFGAGRGGTDDVALAVLPANERTTAQLPSGRRSSFVRHLSQLVDEIEQEDGERRRPDRRKRARAGTEDENAMLGRACATCRGQCCLSGGEHAYLDSPDLRRFWSTRPSATGASIADAYLEALPGRSYSGSCVFHGISGCALPREMRAEICNAFLCDGAQGLRTEIQAGRTGGGFLVAAAGGELLRAVVVDAGGASRRLRKR